MNTPLGLQTLLKLLLLLALVAASTTMLVAPEFFGARANPTAPMLLSMLAVGHA